MPDDTPELSVSISQEIKAAMRRWEPLAAFAWDRYLSLGRGAVVISRQELTQTSDEQKADATADFEPSYVPLEYVPPSDDFLPLMHQYDPAQEFLLVVSDPEGADTLLRLQGDNITRFNPQRCWEQSDFATAKE